VTGDLTPASFDSSVFSKVPSVDTEFAAARVHPDEKRLGLLLIEPYLSPPLQAIP
jgi:hypothetical protein